jgi:hypothetical protein
VVHVAGSVAGADHMKVEAQHAMGQPEARVHLPGREWCAALPQLQAPCGIDASS